jgi:hypothetical protein
MMIDLKLKFWQSKGELAKLRNACQAFWDWFDNYLQFPLQQMDAETCVLGILNLLAWQRNIEPLVNEPEALFRKRVKYAFVNSKDAGSTAGFIRIFQRLGIGEITIEERHPDRDWDVIILNLSDETLGEYHDLLNNLIRQYGRLCRRYELMTTTTASVPMAAHEFNYSWDYTSAEWIA